MIIDEKKLDKRMQEIVNNIVTEGHATEYEKGQIQLIKNIKRGILIMAEINKIMLENYQRMRRAILKELQEEFLLGLSRKFHPEQIDTIMSIFEEAKDRV